MRARLPNRPRRGPRPDEGAALAQRWRGQRPRLEVWYATLTEARTGVGCWIHHEIVAPVAGEPYAHGWAAIFRPDANPLFERFGPAPVSADRSGRAPLIGGSAMLDPPKLRGETGRLAWDLTWRTETEHPSPPLFTFPAWAWERETLPAAQVVAVPDALFEGTIRVDTDALTLAPGTRGGISHIYGHGNAQRWGWLHAELGERNVLEIVSAVSRRPGLKHLPPLSFVQLRLGGRDWPRDPLVAAPLFRARLGLPTWQVRGTVGRWRLRAEVTIPEAGSVRVGYVDPDGASATCVNSEVADAEIVLEHRRLEHRRSVWEVEAQWQLHAGAHAEIGSRP